LQSIRTGAGPFHYDPLAQHYDIDVDFHLDGGYDV
jgi:hypothetical protein